MPANSDAGDNVNDAASKAGSDLFSDDDEQLGGLLKSLISAQGLQYAWQRIAHRLQAVEQSLQGAQACLEKFPADYITRAEYDEQLLRQEGLHARNTELDDRINTLSSSLAETLREEFGSQFHSIDARLHAREDVVTQVATSAEEVRRSLEELRETFVGKLSSARELADERAAQTKAEREAIQADVDGKHRDLGEGMSKLEVRMQEFTRSEVAHITSQLNSDGDSAAQTAYQQQLLAFLGKKLIGPLKAETTKISEKADRLAHSFAHQTHDFTWHMKNSDKTVAELNTRMSREIQDMKDDINTRTKRSDSLRSEAAMASALSDATASLDTLQSKVTVKLNEFVDHFGKMHETLNDHEHCLRHHAEELENRSTKYDFLLCQSIVDKCAQKEPVDKGFAEMKAQLAWMSTKVENFGLGMTRPAVSRKVGRRGTCGTVSSRGGRGRSRGPTSPFSIREKSSVASKSPNGSMSRSREGNYSREGVAFPPDMAQASPSSTAVAATKMQEPEASAASEASSQQPPHSGRMTKSGSRSGTRSNSLQLTPSASLNGIVASHEGPAKGGSRTGSRSNSLQLSPSASFNTIRSTTIATNSVDSLPQQPSTDSLASQKDGGLGFMTRQDSGGRESTTSVPTEVGRRRSSSLLVTSPGAREATQFGGAGFFELDSQSQNDETESVRRVSHGGEEYEEEEYDEDDDFDDESEGDYFSPTVVLLRQQLECMAMGIVALAHLNFRGPQTGTSRQAKLTQEKELLQELMQLRHWITNKSLPAGWDPTKIKTVALQCTHHREGGRQSLPHMTLKRLLMSQQETSPSDQGKRHTLDGKDHPRISVTSLSTNGRASMSALIFHRDGFQSSSPTRARRARESVGSGVGALPPVGNSVRQAEPTII